MSRKPRIYTDTQMYHVILRGNDQQDIFHTKKDRHYFLTKFEKYSKELNIEIYAFCLMTNHIHLIIGHANSSLSSLMQKIGTSYAMYFNRKYDRTGHLFQGRFLSEPINTNEYFKTVIKYVLYNPEKAGICKFQQYKWSSYSETITESSSVINTNTLFSYFTNKHNFMIYMEDKNIIKCMDFENQKVINDYSAIQIIQKILHISNPHLINKQERSLQIKSIKSLQNAGLSVCLISRITGLSRYKINSA